jgi:hypothetical protein
MPTNTEFKPPSGKARRLFDLPESEGLNDSERILTALCRKSFLRLWSLTNVFTDEGFKDGKGSTRELCDALVIFGSDVIIFSDKHITFQVDRDLSVAWPRWYKRAVLDSCKQLHGAKSWLQRFPNRTYLDAKCTRLVPVSMPIPGSVRFHLVAVTRGSREAALAYNGGDGLGSFGLNSATEGDGHFETPFTIGLPEPDKHFVHVFDEVSIELLLGELDTAADLLDYLKKREALLGRRGTQVAAYGEEELLAAYLRTMDSEGLEHVFFETPAGEGLPDAVFFSEGFYRAMSDDPGYKRKKLADSISYEWDRLISRFLEYGDPGLHERYVNQSAAECEQGLRLMAAESRFRRRQLAEAFIGGLRRVAARERLGRLVYGGVAGETVYVFVVVGKQRDETYDEYRQYRIAVLHAYVRTARLKAPLGTTFVGIAFDNPQKDYEGESEDLFVLLKETWTVDELAEIEAKRRELGLWGDAMEFWRYRQDEFPQADQRVALRRVLAAAPRELPQERRGDSKAAEKRLRKMQRASKRRNRGKK